MGWETNVPTMLSFNKETYRSIYEVETAIEEVKEEIQNMKEDLLIYVMGDIKTFLEDDETPMSFKYRVKELIEEIENYAIKLFKLECLLENFKCVGGDFVENPNYEESIKEWMKDSYINGNIEYYNEQKNERAKETEAGKLGDKEINLPV